MLRAQGLSSSFTLAALLALGACGGGAPAGPCTAPRTTCSGVCTDTQTDPLNCGACGNACPGGESCVAGQCQAICPAGSLLCGATCVDVGSDQQNCGSCGSACAAGEACVKGACVETCAPGFAVCAPAGSEVSASYCANLQTDSGNCGACGNACASGQLCQVGSCVEACALGRSACPATGAATYCADLSTDVSNCGACGNVCAGGRACFGGTCACPVPTPDSCGSGSSAFCTSLQSDTANCGACGNACAAGQYCQRGSCVAACTAGFSACPVPGPAAYCANLSTDAANCGACGNACAAGEACAAGHCATACASGLAACGGACVDLSTSRAHCGACGVTCAAMESCVGGSCLGPVAFWPFEGNADDMTGDGNNGKINGATPFVQGYAGQALKFGGSTSWVQVASPENLPLGASPRTIEAWVQPGTLADPSHNGIVAWGGLAAGCTDPGQLLSMTATDLLSAANGCNYLNEAPTGTAGQAGVWSHVAYTFDGTARTLYLDGIVQETDVPAPFSTPAGPLAIGSADEPGRLFSGIIDEVKIYGYARPSADILYDATAVAHYAFDDSDLGRDSGPNRREGTAVGATAAAGRLGQAIAFTGGSCSASATATCSYFGAGGLTALGVSGEPFSIELWIEPMANQGTLVHLASAPDGGGWCTPLLGFSAPTPTPLLVAQVFDGAKDEATTDPTPVAVGTWTHVAMTWSPVDGLRLYANGALVASNAVANVSIMSGVPGSLLLGGNGPGGVACDTASISRTPFAGAVDDVKVYARELTAAEIAADAMP